ncbi:MAG: ABC transporter ATP-binding protein [Flavobacteriaceae bacterium]|jgi:Cu-processing system ATP-binding protein|nr:ABC transporter ATP-binding protein [Flavobacteriaceae bacterium]MBT4112672.1 ABC transporter ATP-binding protein [Flavobacteriaceae bacterium]MBT4614525.1 ABC transporter ATP-binding protein [Flavobacteriaceae bacterium]MBT5246978.1 ABC transporter ATP-binding protein [Flavobacteriaceae bacterium]MBT5650162.1 ABC transporter ATP-binding protein [Flavobacteriaceae bacterium]
MLSISNLNKSFGKLKVLQGININIFEGDICAILGPNGSGKTTLIKTILGLVIPDFGSIKLNDKEIINTWSYRSDISYLPQITNFPSNLTVVEIIDLIKTIRPNTKMDKELIDLFNIKKSMNKKLVDLSGGTKQKVNIILTFMSDSPIIILDEPTAGLDPISLIKLKTLIIKEKEKGKTIIVTSHIMSFIEEISNDIFFLLDGSIFFNGTITDLKERTNENSLESAIANLLKQSHV